MIENDSPHSPALSTKTWLAFIFLFLLVCAARLLPLLTATEHTAWSEELAVGTIAKELKEGAKLPLDLYQWDDYAGESLWLGALGSFTFRIFGDTLFALKTVPLATSIFTWILTFFFIYRYFGIRAAFYTGLLRLALPPLFARYALVVLGGHSEALLFNILVYITFYDYLFDKKGKSIFSLCFFGLIAGLGVWYHPLISIAVLACLLSWFFIQPLNFLKNIFPWCLLFFAGFSPWMVHNMSEESQGWGFLLYIFTITPESGFLYTLKRLGALIVKTLPNLFTFAFPYERDHPGYQACYALLFFLLFFWSVGILFYGRHRLPGRLPKKQWPILLYPFLFLLLYSLSNMNIPRDPFSGKIDFRYCTLFYFFACLLMGIALSYQKKPRWISFVFIFFLAFGVWGQAGMYFKEPFGQAFRHKGFSYARHFYKWEKTLPTETVCKAPTIRRLLELSEENLPMVTWPDSYFRIYGLWNLCANAYEYMINTPKTEDQNLQEALKITEKKFPASSYGWIYDKIGNASAFRRQHDWNRLPKNLPLSLQNHFYNGFFRLDWSWYRNKDTLLWLEKINTLPEAAQPFASRNIGKFMDPEDLGWQTSPLLARLSPQNKEWFYHGVGYGMIPNYYAQKAPQLTGLLNGLPEEFHSDLLQGLGWRIRRDYIEDRRRGLDILMRFPKAFIPDLLKGFEDYENWAKIPEAPPEKGLLNFLKET